MRFDVPVVGLPTVESMKLAGATALAIDANRTLLFDREKLIAMADAAGIAIQAFLSRKLWNPPAISGNEQGMSERGAAREHGKIRVGVVGAGEFGRNHARVYREMDSVELVGVVDQNAERAEAIAQEFGTRAFKGIEDLQAPWMRPA